MVAVVTRAGTMSHLRLTWRNIRLLRVWPLSWPNVRAESDTRNTGCLRSKKREPRTVPNSGQSPFLGINTPFFASLKSLKKVTPNKHFEI